MLGDADMVTRYLADRDLPCPRCGFNLRGVGAAACPECGRRLGLSMLLLHEQYAIPRAGERVANAARNLRLAGAGLVMLALATLTLSFPSITGLLAGVFMLVLAAGGEGGVRWYRRRLDERAMHESAATWLIDRCLPPVAVVLVALGALAAAGTVLVLLVRP